MMGSGQELDMGAEEKPRPMKWVFYPLNINVWD